MNGKIRGFSGYVAEGPPPYAPENGSNMGKQGAFQIALAPCLPPKLADAHPLRWRRLCSYSAL
ncbi:MAG: hypothetical protein RR087_11150, partial [Oscillospiraceae bacterium]